ncbi:hypothetical protein DYB25_002838 [Aphanomyces astaci]|uniref:Nucleoside diphosphate kinase-like domain-containing protein n=1 Tax=Aphanomyces astaci TaxID=112090 RepID=A0A397A4Z9_APHAT|nr:hypothetical protein DYB25_002838 [Aphanomyces astaci]RHY72735.1 hypothetical protein DYB38_008935 [Aphanomyces astaci]
MGPTNSKTAKDQYPHSIRGQYGIDGTQNATHGSDSRGSADREISLLFHAPVAVPLGASVSTKEVAGRPIQYLSRDKTLHEALARGVTLLCQQDPKLDGLEAVAWLGRFLATFATNERPETAVVARLPSGPPRSRRSQKAADLGIFPLAALHVVGFFGRGSNRTLLATQIAKDFNYHYMDMDLHYVPSRPHLATALTQHTFLADVHGAFSPRILLVHDRNRVIPSHQWHDLAQHFRWSVLDFSALVEQQVGREASKGHAGVYSTMARTKETMPLDLIVRLLAQAIAITPTVHRFVTINVPPHALLSAGFVSLVDTTTRCFPPTQLINIEPNPLWRNTNLTSLEWRGHALGHVVPVWVDGPAESTHLQSILQPVLAPTVAFSIDEGIGSGGDDATILATARARGYLKLSAKDALRAEILARSADGVHIHELVQANEPIPDDVVVRVLHKFAFHPHHRRIFLDDFPATVEQTTAISVGPLGSPSMVLRSHESATPFKRDILTHLALSHAVVTPTGPNLHAHLSQLTASAVLGDVSDLDVSRLQRHFHVEGVHVLPIAHVEASVDALWPHPGHPMDDRSFVELVCLMLRQRNLRKVLFIGFPRTLLEAQTFRAIGIDFDHVAILTKKVMPVPHALTDEDYYSSDEEVKARKKNAPEPQLSQLSRYFTDTAPRGASQALTYVDITRVYPHLEAWFRPNVILAVGNKASGFHDALQRAAHSSNCVYVHVPTLHAQHVQRFPSSDRAKRIRAAWTERRLVDVEVTVDLVKTEVLRHPVSTRVVLTGFPRMMGNTMPYVHDQVAALTAHVGEVNQLLHFTASPATLLARVGTIEAVHAHTDAFNAENAPLVAFCIKVNKVVTTVSADVSLGTLTEDIQTLLLT